MIYTMKINPNKYLAIVALTALIFCSFYSCRNDKLQSELKAQTALLKEAQAETTSYKNKYGQEVAKKLAAETTIKALQQSYGDELKVIKDQLGINTKDIKGILKATTETTGKGNGKIDTLYLDKDSSKYAIGVKDSTQYFRINGVVSDLGFDYTYTTYDSITLVPYREGKQLFVKGISSNPNTKITGLQGILVHTEPRIKRFGIGPFIGATLSEDLKPKPVVGIGVQYNFIRF